MQKSITLKTGSRITTMLFILAIPMIIGFYALSNIEHITEFHTLTTFYFIYLGFGFGLLFAQVNLKGIKNQIEDLAVFYTLEIDKNGIKWILVGLVGVFATVGITLSIGRGLDEDALRNVQIFGIIVSGFVMMIAFLKTNSIFVPILIHGAYNSFVVFLKTTSFAVVGGTTAYSGIPIRVPEIGIGFQGATDLYSEMIWQFTLVATAEEFLKLGILVFVVLLLNGFWKSKGLSVTVGAIISVIFWSLLHTIQAL